MSDTTTGTTATPREVVEALLARAVDNDRDGMADLYAADVSIDLPFAAGGIPSRVEGRETLRSQMHSRRDLWKFTSTENVHLHETADPEVIIAEYEVHGTVTASGKDFVFRYITVTRVRNGLIVSSRDYFNPLESATALGMLPELLASAAEGSGTG